MIYTSFPSGPFETNAYVLFSETSPDAVIIDPSPGSFEKIVSFIEEKNQTPKEVWLTHSHFDHIADVALCKKKWGLKVKIHGEDAPNLIEPGADGLPTFLFFEGVVPDDYLQEGEVLTLGESKARVIHTPGHTPGGVCFYFEKEGLLFSGDTLFKGTIGNLSFPTAREALMWQSLKKLAKLPKKTVVLPGHGESTTIGNEPWLDRAEEYFG